MRIDIRNISSRKVQQLCIEYDLYTYGTNQEYSKMLTMCDNAQHASDVYTISYDIVMHSELINLHECIGYGDVNIYDDVEAIANRILNECTTYRFNSEENERRF